MVPVFRARLSASNWLSVFSEWLASVITLSTNNYAPNMKSGAMKNWHECSMSLSGLLDNLGNVVGWDVYATRKL